MISILHIGLDIKHPNIQRLDISKGKKFNGIHVVQKS